MMVASVNQSFAMHSHVNELNSLTDDGKLICTQGTHLLYMSSVSFNFPKSIRSIDNPISSFLDRSTVRRVIFPLVGILRSTFSPVKTQEYEADFTDEAALLNQAAETRGQQ